MEWISLIISIFSFLLSVFSFIKYDGKIKKQDSIINQYKLKQIEEEKQKNNCAKICGSIIRIDNWRIILKITNTGLSIAKNIDIPNLKHTDTGIIQTGKYVLPYKLLNPEEHIEIPFMLSESAPDTIKVEYTWDDKHKQGNSYEQILQL